MKGCLHSRTPDHNGCRIRITCDLTSYNLGESISVNGVCLTVEDFKASQYFEVAVSPETLNKTSLGTIHNECEVNLERPLTPTSLMGGHFVTGHVDALGEVISVDSVGEYLEIEISYPCEFKQLLVEKGSIAMDGVSLTVNRLNDFKSTFSIMLIPHTLEKTNFNTLHVGSIVNLEFDMIGKYLLRSESFNKNEKDVRI